jgi:alkylation response protein AidB-like acyl-CoA dehydrogenase
MASRLTISWIFVGAMASSFEYAYDYAMKILRNGIPIARSQLVQERFVRMMGEI